MTEEVKYIIETTETNIGYIHILIKCIKKKQFNINRTKSIFKHDGSLTKTFFRIEFYNSCDGDDNNVIYTLEDMLKFLDLQWMICAFDSFEMVKFENGKTK